MTNETPERTNKGNTIIQDVWVTHWDVYNFEPHVESVSLRPWEADYDAPITRFADNTRFVNADRLKTAESRLAEAIKTMNQCRLAFAGYVSGQSAIDMLDNTLAKIKGETNENDG